KNCIKKDSITITVENHYYFNLPTAFSPNDDGHNDEYKVIHQNIATADVQIFDRWGRVLFQSNDINATWNGTFQGKSVPEGVYVIKVVYRILGIDYTNYASGTITLLR
ncbi:MAG: T9SS type B sorting domain-containing protein, partial [Bacteroidia bacterium]